LPRGPRADSHPAGSRRDEPNDSHLGLCDCALSVGSFPRRGRLPGAARSLNARLQVCHLRLVVTVGVLLSLLLNVCDLRLVVAVGVLFWRLLNVRDLRLVSLTFPFQFPYRTHSEWTIERHHFQAQYGEPLKTIDDDFVVIR
jgi:hypothetical protein